MENERFHCLLVTPNKAALFLNTLPLAANRVMARQLTRKAENLLGYKKHGTTIIAE